MNIPRFSLTNAASILAHMNVRAEKLGPKNYQPAADLRITAQLPGAILDSFSESLMDQLFKQDLASPIPRESDLVYPVRYAGEMTECEVVIETGVDNQMRLQDCKVNNFDLTPMKGGYVEVTARIQCRPTPEQAGVLYSVLMKTVQVSIKPPEKREPTPKPPRTPRGEKKTDASTASPLH